MAGQARVNDRDPRSIHNDVNVDDIGADAVQSGREPSSSHLLDHRAISTAHRDGKPWRQGREIVVSIRRGRGWRSDACIGSEQLMAMATSVPWLMTESGEAA
jgi:hypothetical protein